MKRITEWTSEGDLKREIHADPERPIMQEARYKMCLQQKATAGRSVMADSAE